MLGLKQYIAESAASDRFEKEVADSINKIARMAKRNSNDNSSNEYCSFYYLWLRILNKNGARSNS